MQHTHYVSVAALVTNEAGEILLIKSPNRGWEYPGGMVEPGRGKKYGDFSSYKETLGKYAGINWGGILLCVSERTI